MKPDSDPPPGPVPAWLPNAITAARIALVPVALLAAESCRAAVAGGAPGTRERAAVVATFLTIGASDLVDGWIARRYGLASRFGAVLDALADKMAQVFLVLFLVVRAEPAFPPLPVAFLVVVAGRDVVLGGGWLWLQGRRGGARVVHRLHGKATSAAMFVLLLAALLAAPHGVVTAGSAGVALAAAASALLYVRDGWLQVSRER